MQVRQLLLLVVNSGKLNIISNLQSSFVIFNHRRKLKNGLGRSCKHASLLSSYENTA